MLSIEVRGSEEFGEKLYGMSDRLRDRWNRKLDDVTALMELKILENLSGKILQTKTGQLKDSIKKETHHSGYEFIGFVGPVPATAKAYALEYGGKSYYSILPTKGRLLHWFDENGGEVFAKRVSHPPSKEYAYLREALEDVRILLPSELISTIEGAIR